MDNTKYLRELSDISARMSKILQEKAGNDTRGQIGKKLEEAENAREDATARITAAMEEGDSKALIKASRDQGEANLLIEMYEKQLDKIMHGPLITAEEYRELVQQLEQIEKRANAEGGQEIVTLALQIQTEAGKLREILGETDHLLRGLQCDIYRRADTGVKNGGGFIPASKEKCVKNWAFINWAGEAITYNDFFNNEIVPAAGLHSGEGK